MRKNNTMFQIDGWMGRLPFIWNGIKAWLLLMPFAALFVYSYLDHFQKLLATDPNADTSSTFLLGAAIIGLVFYALIFPSLVKRLRDITGKDLKKPYLLAFAIIIGLNIPIVGFITGLVIIAYPGVFSKDAAD